MAERGTRFTEIIPHQTVCEGCPVHIRAVREALKTKLNGNNDAFLETTKITCKTFRGGKAEVGGYNSYLLPNGQHRSGYTVVKKGNAPEEICPQFKS
ncbi:hypothetical protein JXA63_00570 [Candidatus Woesebacteria bacterium]|nr:hypothetical protein [Candidatus Woesebacteria bacterium]